MADVFISYAKEGRRRADQVNGALTRDGSIVWRDAKLRHGERYRDAIHCELNAAKSVVVLWSNESVKSDYAPPPDSLGPPPGAMLQGDTFSPGVCSENRRVPIPVGGSRCSRSLAANFLANIGRDLPGSRG